MDRDVFVFDSNIPIAVFLGMHLLFTDPSTSPRTELGRIIFGVIYGLSVVGLYLLLGWLGAPTFYDKLLQVPLMNLMIKRIDRVAQSNALAWLNPERLGARLTPRRRGLAYVSLWVVVFTALSAANGIGDHHPGHTIPFWEKTCHENRANACNNLAVLLSATLSQSFWLGLQRARHPGSHRVGKSGPRYSALRACLRKWFRRRLRQRKSSVCRDRRFRARGSQSP